MNPVGARGKTWHPLPTEHSGSSRVGSARAVQLPRPLLATYAREDHRKPPGVGLTPFAGASTAHTHQALPAAVVTEQDDQRRGSLRTRERSRSMNRYRPRGVVSNDHAPRESGVDLQYPRRRSFDDRVRSTGPSAPVRTISRSSSHARRAEGRTNSERMNRM